MSASLAGSIPEGAAEATEAASGVPVFGADCDASAVREGWAWAWAKDENNSDKTTAAVIFTNVSKNAEYDARAGRRIECCF